jgi:hypothetical protein
LDECCLPLGQSTSGCDSESPSETLPLSSVSTSASTSCRTCTSDLVSRQDMTVNILLQPDRSVSTLSQSFTYSPRCSE